MYKGVQGFVLVKEGDFFSSASVRWKFVPTPKKLGSNLKRKFSDGGTVSNDTNIFNMVPETVHSYFSHNFVMT